MPSYHLARRCSWAHFMSLWWIWVGVRDGEEVLQSQFVLANGSLVLDAGVIPCDLEVLPYSCVRYEFGHPLVDFWGRY